jgi:nitrate reductase alpha subunit
MDFTRRKFLGVTAAGAGLLLADKAFAFKTLQPAVEVGNPLGTYPDRGWEKIYHDQYRFDQSYTFICAPNDTHMCRVRAFLRNGVVMRLEQNYDHQKIKDIYGNQATSAWNPRMCLKGYTVHRRVYGPYRAKYPMIRKGWKQWADDGFPSLSGSPELRRKYKHDDRGNDEFIRLSWDEATTYVAKGLIAIAKTYSGEEGKRRLLKDGYAPEMLEHWEEAGITTVKMGSSLPLHGVMGKFGIFRFDNMLALLDAHVRGVGPDKAVGAKSWSEYTWRGDQAPGTPFIHGLQTSDIDLNDLRFSKLTIQVGKNLIEQKMPEAHWLTEIMERGGKIVTIAPEYNPPATKSDYWIPVRAGLSDTTIFLYIAKYLIESKKYDEKFVKEFTNLPFLIRTDNLQQLRAHEVFPNYKLGLPKDGVSFAVHGLKWEQYEKVGDFVVYDLKSKGLKPITREDVGKKLSEKGIDPALEWKGKVKLIDGKEVEVMTVMEGYKIHLRDYDLDTVHEITSGAPKELIQRLAEDVATIKPISIHHGEGINHYFNATEHNRACYLILMLTGNLGIPGSGVHTWAGNYKGALIHGSMWSGPGVAAWIKEDPFNQIAWDDPKYNDLETWRKEIRKHIKNRSEGEETAYYGHVDKPLIVNTPKHGRKVFTGHSHMPCPTKAMWTCNTNHLANTTKWHYNIIKNLFPKIDMYVDCQIEWTGSAEYCDIQLPANSWLEFETMEFGGSCSNPFLQIWGKGGVGSGIGTTVGSFANAGGGGGKAGEGRLGQGIKPLHDTKDDAVIFALVAEKLSQLTGDPRFRSFWKHALEGKTEVYIQRVLDICCTTSTPEKPYKVKDLIAGKYGEPGAALMLFRSYPRVPFLEQIVDSWPVYTPTGRFQCYNDEPEVIEYGENFIVHREAVEATPYLPNVIVSTNPLVRPDDYGIPLDAMDPEMRTIRNVKMPWKQVKLTKNPLWEKGYKFYCVTPKSRHTVHSSWAVVDWNWIWSTNFGDPYRMDKRAPGVGDWQLHMNPQAAKDLGINDGDWVYMDANPADRPYEGWKPNDPFYKVARSMLRVKYNPAYPYHFTMTKHSSWMATDRTVKAHETRPDGRALATTGYQSNWRYGSHQSVTRSFLMPMHQLDSVLHKKTSNMFFVWGFDEDNHAVNTVPKETLIKVTKAENGGLDNRHPWEPTWTGFSPKNESDFTSRLLKGELIKVKA